MALEHGSLQLQLLGSPMVFKNGQSVVMPYKKAEAILYFLAVTKKSSRDELIQMFWSDLPYNRSRANLRNSLYIINSKLGDHVIQSDGKERLVFNELAFSEIDLEKWLKNKTDLNYYKGSLLNGFFIKGSDLFDKWLRDTRLHFQNTYCRELKLMSLSGDLSSADTRTVLLRLIKLEPGNEEHYRRLMLIYYEQQKYSEIVNLFKQLVQILKEEYDSVPSVNTLNLVRYLVKAHKELKENDDALYRLKFLGREKEVKEIFNSFNRVNEDNAAQCVLIQGDAGLGKSRLIDEWLDMVAARNRQTIKIQWLSGRTPVTTCLDKPDSLCQPMHVNYDFLRDKKFIVLENLQWANTNDDRRLLSVFNNLVNHKILILMTSRFDLSLEIQKYFQAYQKAHRIKKLLLETLPREAMSHILHSSEQGEKLTETDFSILYHRTDKNIGLLLDQVDKLRMDGRLQTTPYLEYFCESQLTDLTEHERTFLEELSAFQQFIPFRILGKLTGLVETEVVSLLDTLLHRNLLDEQRDGNQLLLSFHSRVLQQYIYQHLSLVRKKMIHENIGNLLESLLHYSLDDLFLYPQLIYHFSQSGNSYKALKYNIKLSRQT
ncbi:MAG: AAA family ATPase [Clostridiales bacterium]|nr:AAA family ATPase [Clostridiales bacterium]MDD7433139.1 AAA family ATPase [Clostridiales bacterium]MDY3062016.1 AAA family ATPase [Eubacteriales bacterium]